MAAVLTPGRLSRQLTPVLGEERADIITSVALGMDSTLADSSVLRHLLGTHSFPALAALYGTALRIARDHSTDPTIDDEGRTRAAKTVALMEQIVALTDAPDPNPEPPPPMPTFEELLRSMGAVGEVRSTGEPLVGVTMGDGAIIGDDPGDESDR